MPLPSYRPFNFRRSLYASLLIFISFSLKSQEEFRLNTRDWSIGWTPSAFLNVPQMAQVSVEKGIINQVGFELQLGGMAIPDLLKAYRFRPVVYYYPVRQKHFILSLGLGYNQRLQTLIIEERINRAGGAFTQIVETSYHNSIKGFVGILRASFPILDFAKLNLGFGLGRGDYVSNFPDNRGALLTDRAFNGKGAVRFIHFNLSWPFSFD